MTMKRIAVAGAGWMARTRARALLASGQAEICAVASRHLDTAQAFGAEIVRAKTIMHGKTSMVVHRGIGVFKGLPQPFEATRYHSLVIDPDTLPEELEMLAWTEENDYHEIMGVKHSGYNIHGVQFHPESILTRCGHDLLRNFLVTISPSYNA